ncbi:CsgE family curli-type amyloid fiber assembly protein [Rubricoccus marinus]|uniref:Curli production assembly/transport component CsgE n=1 Tax=Rubricoccus marinus TaxID=716817 RepID=A0A259U2H7_9BACT|nr:CsgE family curli-type amyloid fiber assembly protein [Rubricoccus marinus]OZC04235.1 hypothetical protein BSZ36_15350 [Rubricoccus marinus]
MRRLFLVSLALLPAGAVAQSPAVPDSSADDTTARAEWIPYGYSRTYRDIVNETLVLVMRESETAADSLRDPQLGIGKLVVDETLTRTGGYFYDVFFRLWRPPVEASFFSVVISESPLPGQGTLIAIQLDGELIYQARLPIREEEAEEVARQAVIATLRRLPRG